MDEASRQELEGLIGDISLCVLLGVQAVLVVSLDHRLLQRLRAEGSPEPRRLATGRLVVERDMLRLVKEEAGAVCADMEGLFRRRGGEDGKPESEEPFSVYSSSQLFSALSMKAPVGEDFGLLGRVQTVDVAQISRRLSDGDIVCLTSLGMTAGGEVRYVPSETLAAEVAKHLKAAKLIFFTRGQRIIDTRRNSNVASMQLKDATAFVDHAHVTGRFRDDANATELVYFLELIAHALSHGTRRGHLIEATRGALLQELYTTDGSGTLVSQDLYEGIRLAGSADVSGILALTDPLARKGLLRARSPYEVERACDAREMFVWKRDDTPMGCASLQCFEDAPEKAELGCFVVAPQCRSRGHGAVLLSYMERVAALQGIQVLFLLTTQAMQWFVEHGFREASVTDLPPCKQRSYDVSRSSRVYIKYLDKLPSEVQERFTFVEVDTLD